MTLFEGAHILIDQEGSGPAWVTFDNFQPKRTDFTPPRREGSALARGWSTLQIRTRRNDWYLNPDLARAQAALMPMPGARAMGFSMGGFAALLFAPALGLEEAILVSPRMPAPITWPKRAVVYADPQTLPPGWEDLAREGVRRLARGLVLYDPHHADDLATARWIQAENPAILGLALPFAGHPATALFREASAWSEVQSACLSLSIAELPAALARLRRSCRSVAPSYRAALAAWGARRVNAGSASRR
jgi:hypothetical protein